MDKKSQKTQLCFMWYATNHPCANWQKRFNLTKVEVWHGSVTAHDSIVVTWLLIHVIISVFCGVAHHVDDRNWLGVECIGLFALFGSFAMDTRARYPHSYGLTEIRVWISNHFHYFLWAVITQPKFNGGLWSFTDDVWCMHIKGIRLASSTWM